MDTINSLRMQDSIHVILHNPSKGDADIIVLLSLIVAILAVFFGPLIQLYISKKQLKAQATIASDQIRAGVLSQNRQQWINTLRNEIADLVGLSASLSSFVIVGDLSKFDEHMQQIAICRNRILLMLNLSENDHKELADKLDYAVTLSLNAKKDTMSEDMQRIRAEGLEIISLSQRILKREWERVKSLQ